MARRTPCACACDAADAGAAGRRCNGAVRENRHAECAGVSTSGGTGSDRGHHACDRSRAVHRNGRPDGNLRASAGRSQRADVPSPATGCIASAGPGGLSVSARVEGLASTDARPTVVSGAGASRGTHPAAAIKPSRSRALWERNFSGLAKPFEPAASSRGASHWSTTASAQRGVGLFQSLWCLRSCEQYRMGQRSHRSRHRKLCRGHYPALPSSTPK